MRKALLAATAALFAAAPAVAAAPTIAITSAPREVQGAAPFQLGGLVGGHGGEDVTLEAKECGSYAPFHQIGGAQTGASGAWSTQIGLMGTSQLRARWRGGVSDAVTVKVHPYMTLTYRGPARYLVWIRANDFFGGARATLQRLSGGRWVKVKTFLIRRADSSGVVSSTATVRAKLKKGTLLRALLPQAQAGRCYLAGTTNTLRV